MFLLILFYVAEQQPKYSLASILDSFSIAEFGLLIEESETDFPIR